MLTVSAVGVTSRGSLDLFYFIPEGPLTLWISTNNQRIRRVRRHETVDMNTKRRIKCPGDLPYRPTLGRGE